MKWSNVKWVYLREVRDQLRDRRTLFTIIVLPLLLYPLLGMSFLQIAQFQREHISRVLVLGAESLPPTPQLIVDDRFADDFCSPSEARLLQLDVAPAGGSADQASLRRRAEQAVQAGEAETVVVFPPDFADKLQLFRRRLAGEAAAGPAGGENARIPQPEIFVNTASDKSRIARDRVRRVLATWRESIVDENLKQRRVPLAATKPFRVVHTDVARESNRRAAIWSKILPFVVLIWALTGAFYPAIDLCAGEKERGTLETLLCSPAQRSEIVWGKLLTVMSFSVATSLLNMICMGATGLFIITQINQLGGNAERIGFGPPPVAAMGWLFLALIPLSALFSALSLAVAAFARSSKEGQYYLMPLLLITIPLMMLPLLPAAELDWGTSLIPVTGMMLLLRSLIEGEYAATLRFAIPVLGTTAVCCAFAVRWAIDQFNNESVLFREGEQWGLGIWIRHLVRDRGETPTLAEGILCGVLLLVIHFFASLTVGMPDGWAGFAVVQVVSLVAFIATPALLMAIILTRDPRKTLLLRRPRPAAVPLAVLLAVTIHPLGLALGQGVQRLYPFNEEMLAQMQLFGGMLTEMQQAVGIGAVLLVIALVPAVCEELAFRGFILSGLRHMGHRWSAIVVSSAFFGATHGILQQSLPAAAIGVVIGYLAVQTGSLLPCIAFHFVYNAMTVMLALVVPGLMADFPQLGWFFTGSAGNFSYHPLVIVVGALLSGQLLFWFRSLPFEATAEETLQEALEHQVA